MHSFVDLVHISWELELSSFPAIGIRPVPCTNTQCDDVCYKAGCTQRDETCTQTCTGSGNCYTRCTKCCTPDGKCRPGICALACLPPGCGIKPTPPPTSGYTCKWKCEPKGRCKRWCRSCCESGTIGKCQTVLCGPCKSKCSSQPKPQQPICSYECRSSKNRPIPYPLPVPLPGVARLSVRLSIAPCFKRCKCCCLNGTCKRYPCLEKCYFDPKCGYKYR